MAIVTVTEDFIASVEPAMLMSDASDKCALVTVQAVRLRLSPPASGQQTAVLVGASGFQHALPDDEMINDMLDAKLDGPAHVHNMTVGGGTHWESAALIDYLDDRIKAVYVVNVSPPKLGWPDFRMKRSNDSLFFGFRSALFDEEVAHAGFTPASRTGIYALDNFQFLLARLRSLRNLLTGPVKFERYGIGNTAISEARRQAKIQEWLPYFDDYVTHKQRRYASLARMIDEIRACGSDIVLLESPLSPRMRDAVPDELLEGYQQDIESFARGHGVVYWNLQEEAQLEQSDFGDPAHVYNHDARVRFADVLTTHLADLFRRQGKSEPTS